MIFSSWARLSCFTAAAGADSDSEDSTFTQQQSLKAPAGLLGSATAAGAHLCGLCPVCRPPQLAVNEGQNPAARCGLSSAFGSQSTLSEDGSYYLRCGTRSALTRENTGVSDTGVADLLTPVLQVLPNVKIGSDAIRLQAEECPDAPRRSTPPPPSDLLTFGPDYWADFDSDPLGIHPDLYNFVPMFNNLTRQATSLSEDPHDAAVYELLEPDMCPKLEHHSWGSTLSC